MPTIKHISSLIPAAKRRSNKTVAAILLALFKAQNAPVIVAVGGPGGTGKSTFCSLLARELPDADVLTLDDYKISRSDRNNRNIYGPHPDANRIDLVLAHLQALRTGGAIDRPIYERVTGEATSTIRFVPRRFVILDGEIATYRQFRSHIDFSIFIDADWKTQLATRISRDIESRGYSNEKAISAFLHSNLKEFAAYGAESKSWADIHLYCHDDYFLEIEAVSEHVSTECKELLSMTTEVIGLNGFICAIPTPFNASNHVDEKSLALHLEFLYEKGVRRVLVNGTSGELFSLTPDEQRQVLRIARYCFPGVVIFGAGCKGLKETVLQLSWAQKNGADAIAVLFPHHFAAPSEQGLVEYFNRITAQASIPVILHNFPRHTGYSLQPSLLRAVKHSGLKDSSGDTSLIPETSSYFTGVDTLIYQSLEQGGSGFVSGISCSSPIPYINMENSHRQKDFAAMKQQQHAISTADAALGGPTTVSKVKYAISRILPGYPETVRLPLLSLTEEDKKTIDRFITDDKI